MNKKYLIATCLSMLLVSPVCFAASTTSLTFWTGDFLTMLGTIQDNLLVVLGAICILMLIIGGAMYMTAREDAGQAKNGMTTIKVALVGLALILAAAMLMNFVMGLG
jgi:hypothetical protein